MPDHPQHPDFGFFAAPDVSTDRDSGDELDLEYTYPQQPETVTRVTDGGELETLRYENAQVHLIEAANRRLIDELLVEHEKVETLRTQLTAARQALADVYDAFPVFIRERLEPLRAILERE